MASRISTCQATVDRFRSLYGFSPQFVSVAPGRVNLIGEHVDHQGYSVLPAALNHTIQVAIGVQRTTENDCPNSTDANLITLSHANSEKFPPVVFKSADDLKVAAVHSWANYIIASLFGVIEYATDSKSTGQLVKRHAPMEGDVAATATLLLPKSGIKLLVDGAVPVAAGVSSSSALVVAVTCAFSRFLKVEMSRSVLADVCSNSERHVGTAGGGMDQAAICLSEQGMARLIHFNPLITEAVPLPPDGVLVICNSCREAPKAVHVATCYNKRVFELKIACYMMLTGGFPDEEIPSDRIPKLTLKIVQEKFGVSMKEAIEVAKKYISHNPMGKREAEQILGDDRLQQLLKFVGPAVWERNVYFDPLRRVIHVYDEAQRVLDFAAVCRDSAMSQDDKLKTLGCLLDASDESLSLYFDCGCPELSEVTNLARKSGAYGSRMTGAGWGGCVVSLVHKNQLTEFLEKMKPYFSRTDRLVPLATPASLADALFHVIPDDGASVFVVAENGAPQKIEWS